MIRLVPPQSRAKIWILVVLLLMLAVVGSVSYLGWRQTVPGVQVTSAPPRFIAAKTTLAIGLEARRGSIVNADVRVIQGGRSAIIAKQEAPLGSAGQLSATFEGAALGLREGSATLEVRARDDFWRPIKPGDRPVATFPVTVDLTPPKIEILSSTQYMSPGGVGLVAFRVEAGGTASVTAGPRSFRSFPIGPPERGARVALLALPYDVAPGTTLAISAQDEAGNVATRTIPFELKPRRFPHDRIEVKDAFLNAKVPELLPQRPPSQPLIEAFLVINRDQRKQAEAEKQRIGQKTADSPLWEGAFVQPRNTKVFANFAETRTYFYQGREVDQQVHYGYDLASTKQSPVPAANSGVVAFTGPLTIYGNAVIIDHGWGLQSLYGHLSSIDVKPGDKVEQGRELGRTGSTGLALGDHLHYEMLVNGISVTPVEWWDAKWIRDHVNLPLKTADLPEIKGAEVGERDEAASPTRPARRRRAR
jgi:murein DD-endopeptidase MepM/ murein hydrolase activator NlpD